MGCTMSLAPDPGVVCRKIIMVLEKVQMLPGEFCARSWGAAGERIRAWEQEGLVTWLGRSDDVRAHIAAAECVVLPSYYREGTPKSLLEAASMGKPLITTDAVGCRQTVDDGVNGFLCRPRDAEDLAAKMRDFLALSAAKREQMGQKSREKMVREFDERIVLGKYMAAVREIGGYPFGA